VHGEQDVQALLKEASRPRLEFPWSKALALRDRALLELLYGAGLRARETREARVLDLRLQEGLLLVRRAKRGEPASLPLPRRSLEALGRYLEEGRPRLVKRDGRDQGVLLVTKQGTPLSRSLVDRTVRLIARRVGMRSTPHAFRRSVATQLLSSGVSVTAIQELLGHRKLETTARYLAVSREELRRAVERLEPIAPRVACSREPEERPSDPRP
jgi:site-specific recombinase XerD